MNTKQYRIEYQKERGRNDKELDIDFIGCTLKENNKIIKKGFIELTHGDKENIKNFIETHVKIAEDGQAIYEFLQNAVDANSTNFFIFYDKENFLVINNGEKFQKKDVRSILNFSQSTKSNKDKLIGKFGVGFKLIHRLVGKDSGVDEIVDKYKGPILFSWDNNYLQQLLNNNLEEIDKHWLFKIIYTNFPCGLDESVKNQDYKTIKPFPKEEFEDMVKFIKKQNIDLSSLKEGTLFYLKLGDSKYELLKKEENDLKKGIGISLNILHSIREGKNGINNVLINKETIKKDNLVVITNKQYVFLYPKDSISYFEKNKQEKVSFYKFFPMGDQINGFNFALHHYDFEVETNRRKLQENNKNRALFKKIWLDLEQKLNKLQETNRKQFLEIISNFYLSDLEKANGNRYIVENFTKNILNYIKTNIPIEGGKISSEIGKVKIIETKLTEIPLKKFKRFYFQNSTIIKEAQKKLKLEKWDIVKVLLKEDKETITKWIFGLEESQFKILLEEIKKHKKKELTEIFDKSYSLKEIKKVIRIISILTEDFAVIQYENKYEIDFTNKNYYIKNFSFKEFLGKHYGGILFLNDYYLIPDELEKEIISIIGKQSKDKEILKFLLKKGEHKKVIDFIEEYKMEKEFLNSLKLLELDIQQKYNKNSFESKTIKLVLKLNEEEAIKDIRNKIRINDIPIDESIISPYITFKSHNKRIKLTNINPGKYKDLYYLNSSLYEIVDCFEDIDAETLSSSIFKSKEVEKEKIYNEIVAYLNLNRHKKIINSYGKLQFLIYYSLENNENYLQHFNGVKFWDNKNKEYDVKNTIEKLYEILSSLKTEELSLFSISDFFPEIKKENNYIIDTKLALDSEQLPDFFEEKHITLFEKIGLIIDRKSTTLRAKIIDNQMIKADELLDLTQNQLKNLITFIALQKKEYKKDNRTLKNIFQKMEDETKEELSYLPVLINKSKIKLMKFDVFQEKFYITKEALSSTNKEFHKRWQREFDKLIYIDILGMENIPYDWELVEETIEDRIKEEEKELSNKEKKLKNEIKVTENKSDDNENKWIIGWLGEKFVYEKLKEKFGAENVIWHNKDSNSINEDKGGIDIEIIKRGRTTHKIEVKSTIDSISSKEVLTFYISGEQYKNFQISNPNCENYLILVTNVTGKNRENREMLVMKIDNQLLSK